MLSLTDIKFEECRANEKYALTTFYFVAPKEYLKELCPQINLPEDTVSAEISIECPTHRLSADSASVMVAATVEDADNPLVDIEWQDVYLDAELVDQLIALADSESRQNI